METSVQDASIWVLRSDVISSEIPRAQLPLGTILYYQRAIISRVSADLQKNTYNIIGVAIAQTLTVETHNE